MLRIIEIIDRYLNRIEMFMVVSLLLVMVLMAFAQVLLRNFLSTGIVWGDIFLRHLVLWVGFIGASLAARESRHINIDVLRRILPPKSLPYIKVAIDLVTAATCFLLAHAGYVFMMMEKEAGSHIFKEVPAWIFQSIIPIGFGLIGFRFLMRTFQDYHSDRKKNHVQSIAANNSEIQACKGNL